MNKVKVTIYKQYTPQLGLPWWLRHKASVCNAGDLGSIPGLGKFPGVGNGSPLSILDWRIPCTEAIVHWVPKSWT